MSALLTVIILFYFKFIYRYLLSDCRSRNTHVEDAVNMLASGHMWFVDLRLCVATKHLVDGTDNVQHFLLAYQTIAVQIVQSEHPLQLLLHRSSRHFRQYSKEFL